MKLVSKDHELLSSVLDTFDFDATYEMSPSEIVDVLKETMTNNNGIGLSANQIGLPYRVFVMKADPVIACFNPIITAFSDDKIVMEEGCLTYPYLFVKIKRSSNIRVRYQNVNGEVITERLSGVSARVFQHELDHLNGINFLSRAPKIAVNRAKTKQKMLQRKINNMRKFF